MTGNDRAVRMSGSGLPRWVLPAGGAFVAVLIAAVLVAVLSGRKEEAKADTRCSSDVSCGQGRICAAGGCILLLSSENADLWREELAAQLTPGRVWSPRNAVGEKIVPAVVCPAPSGIVEKPDDAKVRPVSRVTVVELGAGKITTHAQVSVIGEQWVESVRAWLPSYVKIKGAGLCISPDASFAVLGAGQWRGRKRSYADVALKSAAPAGRVGGAGVAVTSPAPAPDKDGMSVLTIELEPVFGTSQGHTVLAVPLGAEIASLQGPRPSLERLLKGYVVYDWDHGSTPTEVTVRYKVPPQALPALDVASVNP
ncbi:MAG: hypothetical protein PHU25_12235 [Deltaproteobacteria bacterium]|nr:hypothetical protein [Deltaproteobacteria bacterium]